MACALTVLSNIISVFFRGRGDEWDNIDKDTLIQQLEAYQQAIQEWRDEFEKSQKVRDCR